MVNSNLNMAQNAFIVIDHSHTLSGKNSVNCKQEHSEDELCFDDMRHPDCADIAASIAVTDRLT